jgi:hypothetical protein
MIVRLEMHVKLAIGYSLRLILMVNLLVARGQTEDIVFFVIAPDRGFMVNEETRDAFKEYKHSFNASLVLLRGKKFEVI